MGENVASPSSQSSSEVLRHEPGTQRRVERLLVSASRFVCGEARIVKQMPHAACLEKRLQLRPRRVTKEDEAVGAFVHPGRMPHPRLSVAVSSEYVTGMGPHRRRVLMHRHHRLEVRNLDRLAFTRRLARNQSRQSADKAVHPCRVLGVTPVPAERMPVRFAVEIHVTAGRIVCKDIRSAPRPGTRQSKWRDVDLDERRTIQFQRCWRQWIRRGALNHNIRRRNQSLNL